MPEIHHKALADYFNKTDAKSVPAVFLLYGDDYLYRESLELLLGFLMPDTRPENRGMDYETVEGLDQNVSLAVEKLNTFALLSTRKIVAFADARLFESRRDRGKLLQQAKSAYDSEDMKKAGRYLASVIALAGLTYDDITGSDRSQLAKLAETPATVDAGDKGSEWMIALAGWCRDHKVPLPRAGSQVDYLEKAIKRGFPAQHRLIITTETVDKRRKLYQTIREQGLIVDCSVPKGQSRADRTAQEAILREQVAQVLGAQEKTIAPKAYAALCDMTGFDLPTFRNNLEKLSTYVGDRRRIAEEDVYALLKRTRIDPVYELSNAVGERDLARALFFARSLLEKGFHPLQLFSTITNQVRKLLLAKDFTRSKYARGWRSGITYNQFRSQIVPQIVAHDQQLAAHLEQRETVLTATDGPVTEDEPSKGRKKGRKTTKKKTKPKIATDLLIAKNPHNAYPLFQTLLKSENYGYDELIDAVLRLSQADVGLKSSRQAPQMILEELLFALCRQTPSNQTRFKKMPSGQTSGRPRR